MCWDYTIYGISAVLQIIVNQFNSADVSYKVRLLHARLVQSSISSGNQCGAVLRNAPSPLEKSQTSSCAFPYLREGMDHVFGLFSPEIEV